MVRSKKSVNWEMPFQSFQPDVQARIKEEIAEHLKTHGKLTYDNLSELKYMTMVCQGGCSVDASPVPILFD